jgi:hypothetical protein
MMVIWNEVRLSDGWPHFKLLRGHVRRQQQVCLVFGQIVFFLQVAIAAQCQDAGPTGC